MVEVIARREKKAAASTGDLLMLSFANDRSTTGIIISGRP